VNVVDANNNIVTGYNEDITLTTVGPVQETMKRSRLVNGTTSFVLSSINKTGTVKIKITTLLLGTTEFNIVTVSNQVRKLELVSYNNQLVAGGQDNTIVQATVQDDAGNSVSISSNPVRFDINGVHAGTVNSVNGIATLQVLSALKTGVVSVTAVLFGFDNVVVSSSTIELVMIAQSDPKKVMIGLKQGSLSVIPADGTSETILESVITDVNDNKIDSAVNMVTYRINSESGDLMVGTQPVKTVYLTANNGVNQVKFRAGYTAGNVNVSVESQELAGSSMTITVKSGFASKLSFELYDMDNQPATAIVPADGITRLKLRTTVRDNHDNVAENYMNNIGFTVSGNLTIETSSAVKPVNGETVTVLRAGVQTGTSTVTAVAGSFSASIKIISVSYFEHKLKLVVEPVIMYSGETSTVTVMAVDRFDNPVISTRTIVLSATTGYFSNSTVQLAGNSTGKTVYYGTMSGQVRIIGTTEDNLLGETIYTVLPSQQSNYTGIIVSTGVYIKTNVPVLLVAMDNSGNNVVETDEPVMFVVTGNNGDVVLSTLTKLMNGQKQVSLYFKYPAVYKMRAVTQNNVITEQFVPVLMNSSLDNMIDARTVYGDVRVTVPKHLFNKDLVLDIVQSGQIANELLSVLSDAQNRGNNVLKQNTAVKLRALDETNTEINVTFGQNKYITISLSYPDKNQDGIVDGITIAENNLRVWMLITGKWQLIPGQTVDSQLNIISVQIDRLGIYAVMGIADDPVIQNVVVYPNPFDLKTNIGFDMGSSGDVVFTVYTLAGRLIKTVNKQVSDNDLGDGRVVIEYDGTDDTDNQIANGTYMYRLVTKKDNKKNVKTGKITRTR
jgi:hypothetical protein